MVSILHIHHRFMKPSVWLIISPSSSQYLIYCIILLAAFTEQKILSTTNSFINVFGSTSMDFARSIN